MIELVLMCLSMNIYHEGRDQSLAGQLAIAQVTLNRVADPRYPNDVCSVVQQHKQFSWYWDGKSDVPKEKRAWETAQLVASAALAGASHVELKYATSYHAVYVQPYWTKSMDVVARIGDHVFYVSGGYKQGG